MISNFTLLTFSTRIIYFTFLLAICITHNLKAQNFSTSTLKAVSLVNPTSLQFGPDGRLYVSQQNGIIKAFSINRNNANDYTVTATETISLINLIPNHNDDGALNTSVTTRQITSLLVEGTASNPVLYVTSSDSRIGGPSGDLNLDTNSGILSKLTKTATAWDKVDLVRGFPRSEENHATNGMQLDHQTNTLYLTIGGFTNAGSPSANFAYITEYALSAAILAINLTQIEAMAVKGSGNTKYKYDLPTVDDPTRNNTTSGADINDPFGGNDGLNQAKIVPVGPVQIHSTGYRNVYDLVITKTPGKARRMYTVDNGPNQGWGGFPANEGTLGNVTNNYVSGEPGSNSNTATNPQVNNLDGFHYIGNLDSYVAGSYYGGHPNPVRANPAGAGLYTRTGSTGVWRTSKTGTNPLPADWPPVPVSMAHPVEGDYQSPGEADNSLLTFPTSTNGLAEYTASNFNNSLKGNLLAACYNGNIYKIKLNDAGTNVLNNKGNKRLNQDPAFASNFGSQPLDIIAQGDEDIFPGSVWAATYGANVITIFEPADFITCSGQYSTTLDDDGDGYSNADEVDNKINPCSASSKPSDFDGDKISDLKDTDDDNDQIADNVDYFVLDKNNGLATSLPIQYDLFNNYPGTGFFGLGFTGLMSNKKADNDYLNLYKEDNLIAGGAVGAFSVISVGADDALENQNNQENAFQFGVNVSSSTGPFTVQARILGNFFDNNTPQNYQSQGIYIGTGDQDNYLKIALNVNGGQGGIEIITENAGVPITTQFFISGGMPTSTLDLLLAINPATGMVQPKFSRDGGIIMDLGSPIELSGALLTTLQGSSALAIGIVATSRGATPFTATWDFINVTQDPGTAAGAWQTLTSASDAPSSRGENAYVKAGDKFYLIGGRGISTVQVYNPVQKTWASKSNVPMELHHFQAVTLDGLIYVAGAFTGSYPREKPVPQIYIYNPLTDKWSTGPPIPQNRQRGSAGVVVYQNKIYLVGGILDGHWTGHVNWFDEYDPQTNTWQTLSDAPRARDHFHAVVADNKLYVAGGRRSSASTSQTFSLTVSEVDVYDFTSGQWSTLPNSSNLPTQRAGAGTVVLGNEILVIGGESTQPAAHKETEALNINTNVWRRLADLKQARHGTQAIESNNGIYIAMGVGSQGGSLLLSSHEAFYMFSPTTPNEPALTQSKLTVPVAINYGQVTNTAGSGKIVTLNNSEGNQAIVVSAIAVSGDNDFSFITPFSLPFVIPVGSSINLTVKFSPSTSGSKSASLVITHSGNGGTSTTALSGSGSGTISPVYSINSGGPNLTLEGKNWAADQYFTVGKIYSNGQITDITNTNSDQLYKTERSSATPFGYAIPVAAGNYKVNLHFAEIYFGATGGGSGGTGKRIFDVNIEGGTVELPNFDIYAEAAAMKALVKSFDVTVTDGTLNIDFSIKVNQPKISAIEIIALSIPETNEITANPIALHFFSQQAGTSSAAQTVTLTNNGTTGLPVSSVNIMGTDASQFAHNITDSFILNAGTSQDISITFTPVSLGTKTAQLNIIHAGTNSPITIGLTGEGVDNPNQVPIANAGADITINLPTNSVVLNGSGTDPDDGSNVTYTWSQTSGPNTATFNNKTVAKPTVSGLVAGNYVFSLVVKDSQGTSSAADEITITVNNNSTTGQQIVSFILINADTDQEIQMLSSGAILNLATLPTKNLNIRAVTNPVIVGSVKFALTGQLNRNQTESGAPYALFGDNSGNYNAWLPAVGSYNLKATPYSGSGGGGTAGTALIISFQVINQTSSTQYSLTTSVNGSGTVTKNPNQTSFTTGTTVTLTAASATGYKFTGWSGSATGTNNPLTIAMNSNKNIVANFVPVGQQVISLILINADTEQEIQTLSNGATLNLATLPTKNLNIRAVINPVKVGSVKFALTGQLNRNQTESGAPYALFGDNSGNYNAWLPAVGSYNLKATPYSGSGGGGAAGTALTINFQVVNQASRVAVNTHEEQAAAVLSRRVYPNPTLDGQVEVTLNETIFGEVTYELISVTGATLTRGKLDFIQPTNVLKFDFSHYMQQPGIYYLGLRGKNLQEQIKIIRQ